jgi:uncharacterized protein
MNKPAAKEPSMDEILSSIRQIIADDDAATANSNEPAPEEESDTEGFPSFDAFLDEEASEETNEEEVESPPDEPVNTDAEELALSLDQVVEAEEEPEPVEMALLDDQPEAEADESEDDSPDSPDDIAFVIDEVPPEPAPQPSTMPDPDLSDDLAGQLLDETAEAAASEAFSRLGVLSLGAGGQTIEGVVKELLRPMLKSWLDENLPAIVERLVEREIERVSRGGR